VRSFRDLENQKKLQAELLQLQINNEALLEKRVADYQNPNKPPPVPPQYKTASEIQTDTLEQQKRAIDNLRLLGADYAVAAQVSQELLQLPDGDANLVKLNTYFPQIQKFIEDTISSKARNSVLVLMDKLKEYFSRIDTAIGVNIKDTDSTNYFRANQTLGASELPTQEDYNLIDELLKKIFQIFEFNKENVIDPITEKTIELYNASPTEDNISSIDTLPIIERQSKLKEIEQLFKLYKIPEKKQLDTIIRSLIEEIRIFEQKNEESGGSQIYQNPFEEDEKRNEMKMMKQKIDIILASYTNILNGVKEISIKKLKEFTNTFTEKENKIVQEAQDVIAQPIEADAIKKAIGNTIIKLFPSKIDTEILKNFEEEAFTYANSGRGNSKQATKIKRGTDKIKELINKENERIRSLEEKTRAGLNPNVAVFQPRNQPPRAALPLTQTPPSSLGGLSAPQISPEEEARLRAPAVFDQQIIDIFEKTKTAKSLIANLVTYPQILGGLYGRKIVLGNYVKDYLEDFVNDNNLLSKPFEIQREAIIDEYRAIIDSLDNARYNYRGPDPRELSEIIPPPLIRTPAFTPPQTVLPPPPPIQIPQPKPAAGGAKLKQKQELIDRPNDLPQFIADILGKVLLGTNDKVLTKEQIKAINDSGYYKPDPALKDGATKGTLVLRNIKKKQNQGRGLTDKVLKHFNKDNKEMMKLKKGFNNHLRIEKEADSSSDSSKEGRGTKKTFKPNRIKLGKGIAIPEQPKYVEFGKFIIHYPQLTESNILNLKFPSTGTIPHIKPVYIDDNFKEFIIDTLNTGRVNNRHFDSLTEPEKAHFTKIARGAKLTETLNLKPLTEDKEKDELNRLQLILGEINAGNDNDKLLKEARSLVKKYIANGRINKNKGLDILLELQ
jgi:ribosomal protein S16